MYNNSAKDLITAVSQKSIKDDLLHFKNELLIDFNRSKKDIDNKFSLSNDFITQKILVFESRINAYEEKISELTLLCQSNQNFKENINNLLKFKEETNIELMQRKAKVVEAENRILNELSRINATLKNTVIYPEIIGLTCKFQNFHSLIDFILNQLEKLNKFREASNTIDFPVFKKKIDVTVDFMKAQLDNFDKNLRHHTNQAVAESEEKLKNMIKVFNDRLQDSRIENASYSMKIEKKTEELSNLLENVKKIENDIINFNSKNEDFQNSIIKNTTDVNSIKDKMKKIVLILAELKLRCPVNKNLNIKNAYIQSEINKILNDEKKPKQKTKVFSGVKRYIDGLINGEELSTMGRFVISYDGKTNMKPRRNSFMKSNTDFEKPRRSVVSLGKNSKIIEEENEIINNTSLYKINLDSIKNINKSISNSSDSSNRSIRLITQSKNVTKNDIDNYIKSNSCTQRSKNGVKKSENIIREEDENSEDSKNSNKRKKNNKTKENNEEEKNYINKGKEVKKKVELKNKELNNILANYNYTNNSANNILSNEKEKNKTKNYFNNTMIPKTSNIIQDKKQKNISTNLNTIVLTPNKKFPTSNANNLKTLHTRISYQLTENNNHITINKYQNRMSQTDMFVKSASPKNVVSDKKTQVNLELGFNKTYSNYPKIMNSSLFIDPKKSITYKNLRLNQTPKTNLTKNNKQKKILLINPEDIPSNYAWIKKQVMEGNKTINNSSEKKFYKRGEN